MMSYSLDLYLKTAFYFFNHLSNQLKKVRCHSIPFWGFKIQWFSSGKYKNSAGTLRKIAASKACIPSVTGIL